MMAYHPIGLMRVLSTYGIEAHHKLEEEQSMNMACIIRICYWFLNEFSCNVVISNSISFLHKNCY